MRFRLKFVFWLDLDKEGDEVVADMITSLKEKRQFTATIRDGIRLICDLREGKTDVLFDLFPQMRRTLSPSSPVNVEFEQILQKAIADEFAKRGTPITLIPDRAVKTESSITIGKSSKSGKEVANNFISSMKGVCGDWFN